jgi:putative transcriptional regulator
MNKRDFEKLVQGLENTAALAQGDESKARKTHIVPVVDARETREVLNLTRQQFATRFYLSARTLQNWEQGVRTPDDAARLYLLLVRHNPTAVEKMLVKIFEREVGEVESSVPAHVATRAMSRGSLSGNAVRVGPATARRTQKRVTA